MRFFCCIAEIYCTVRYAMLFLPPPPPPPPPSSSHPIHLCNRRKHKEPTCGERIGRWRVREIYMEALSRSRCRNEANSRKKISKLKLNKNRVYKKVLYYQDRQPRRQRVSTVNWGGRGEIYTSRRRRKKRQQQQCLFSLSLSLSE